MKLSSENCDLASEDLVRKTNDSFFERVKEAYNHAIQEGIEANSIVINKNIVKVPATWIRNGCGGAIELPTMICGLNAFWTEGELPEDYSFAVVQPPDRLTRLGQFESIGMEPDELRKAADLYRRIKEVME